MKWRGFLKGAGKPLIEAIICFREIALSGKEQQMKRETEKWRFETKELPVEVLEKKIRYLVKRIRTAGKEIARDDISKDYLLEGGVS